MPWSPRHSKGSTASSSVRSSSRSWRRRPSGVSWPAPSSRPSGRQPLLGGVPVVFRPAAAGAEQPGGHLPGGREEDVRLAAVEAGLAEHRHVSVAPVLAQRRGALPSAPSGSSSITTSRFAAKSGRPTVSACPIARCSSSSTSSLAVACGASRPIASAASACPRGEEVRGGRVRPGVGDGPPHHVGVEVGEGCLDDARGDGAHRGGPGREVAHPEAAQPRGLVRLAGLGREVGDRMDRLEALPHLTGLNGMHAVILPRQRLGMPPGAAAHSAADGRTLRPCARRSSSASRPCCWSPRRRWWPIGVAIARGRHGGALSRRPPVHHVVDPRRVVQGGPPRVVAVPALPGRWALEPRHPGAGLGADRRGEPDAPSSCTTGPSPEACGERELVRRRRGVPGDCPLRTRGCRPAGRRSPAARGRRRRIGRGARRSRP